MPMMDTTDRRTGNESPRGHRMRFSMRKETTDSGAADTTAESIRIDSRTLFQGQREICIGHAGQTYRLRITRQDKLILTK